MLQKNRLNILFPIGASLVFAASLFKLNNQKNIEYFFSAGALLLIIYHGILLYNVRNEDKTRQRMYRTVFFSSLLLAVGSYFMFTGANSWSVTVLIYAVTILYSSFRLK